METKNCARECSQLGIETKQRDRLGFMEGEGRVPGDFNTMGESEIESMFYDNKWTFLGILSYKIWAAISPLTFNFLSKNFSKFLKFSLKIQS